MSRKIGISIALTLAATVTYCWAREHLSLDEIVASEVDLRLWIRQRPLRAFLLGLSLYTLLSFVPGTTGKSIVYGWLFGFWSALIQVNLALTAAAMGSFFLSRYFLRDAVESRLGFYVQQFNKALARHGGSYVASLRMLHVPFTFVNYAFGATAISWKTFWWSSQLGLLPGNIVFVLAGAQLPSLGVLAREGPHAVISPGLTAAFVLMAAFPWAIQRIVRRWRGSRDEDLHLPA